MKNLRVIGAGLFVLACGVVGVGGYVATGTGTTATGSTPAWVAKYMATGQRDFRDGRGRFGRAGPLSSYTPSFELDREYLWPSATPAYPDPVNDPVFGATARRPIAVCYVGAVDGSITEWQCKGRDGLAFGTYLHGLFDSDDISTLRIEKRAVVAGDDGRPVSLVYTTSKRGRICQIRLDTQQRRKSDCAA